MPFNSLQSSHAFLVVVPGVVLSEHDTLAEARTAKAKAVKQGYEQPVILKRTPKGWQLVK